MEPDVLNQHHFAFGRGRVWNCRSEERRLGGTGARPGSTAHAHCQGSFLGETHSGFASIHKARLVVCGEDRTFPKVPGRDQWGFISSGGKGTYWALL